MYDKLKELLGYYPSADYIHSWGYMSPWIYIERTAECSTEVNATYSFVSYDTIKHELTLKRSYDQGPNDGKEQICFDIIEIRQYRLFDVYNQPSDLNIIIIED
jgi:hypothetical protein